MASSRIATVFGASGFIGRYVVKNLADRGFIVRAATRTPERCMALRPLGRVGQIVPLYAPLGNEADMTRAIEGADSVINLVGIIAERRPGDFDRIHHHGAGALARIAAEAGVRAFVHVSALGADPAARSRYASTKGLGEAVVRSTFPGAVILRPSVVFGPEDRFLNLLGRMAALFPILPVFEGATRFQPVYAGDVAAAVLAGLDRADTQGRIFELGGPDIRSFRDLIDEVLVETRRHRTLVTVPRWLAMLEASVLEHLPGRMLTRDQLLLLRRDNVVAEGSMGLEALGITPTPMRLVVPDYLRRYRPAGHKE
ncbi:MAG TPA: complex I NDUFA9 subunit family protein [Acidiphilium sp.]